MKRIILTAAAFLIATQLFAAGEKRYAVPFDSSPVHGNKNAAVTIVEFIDYQ